MGDAGKIYVAPSVVPAYKSLLRSADLLLPNQFEAELLSEVKITGLLSLATAIQTIHREYMVPHIIITSVRFNEEEKMSVIGSSATSDGKPRLFRITIPSYPVFFSGTGDMFAAWPFHDSAKQSSRQGSRIRRRGGHRTMFLQRTCHLQKRQRKYWQVCSLSSVKHTNSTRAALKQSREQKRLVDQEIMTRMWYLRPTYSRPRPLK